MGSCLATLNLGNGNIHKYDINISDFFIGYSRAEATHFWDDLCFIAKHNGAIIIRQFDPVKKYSYTRSDGKVFEAPEKSIFGFFGSDNLLLCLAPKDVERCSTIDNTKEQGVTYKEFFSALGE